MKKALPTLLTLFALAPGAVLAQSNVVVYGVADAGLVYERGGAAVARNISSGIASGSRLGFKGSEELGNGLNANFVLESGFGIDTGASGQGGLLFGRQAYVGLSSRNAGAVTLGRQYSPYYRALRDVADPFAIGLAGTASNLMTSNTRVDNMAGYTSPVFLGLSADLAYGAGESALGSDANRSLGAALNYVRGPARVTLTHHRRDNAAASDKASNTLLAVKYDFGVAQANFGYAANDGLAGADSHDLLLGLSAPLGAHKLLASYIRHVDENAAAKDARQWALGYLYSLSKRTDLYAAYAHINNKNGATYKVGNATDIGTGNTGVNLGMRHAF